MNTCWSGSGPTKGEATHTTQRSPKRTVVSPDERSNGCHGTDTQSPGMDLPSYNDLPHKPDDASAVREEFDSSDNLGMPQLAEHTLTDTHSCTRLPATLADRLVVAHTPRSNLPSVLYAVDAATGLVSSSRDRIMAMSMQVADQLLSEYDERNAGTDSENGQCADPGGLPELPSRAAVINHAKGLRSSRAPKKHQDVVGGAWSTTMGSVGPWRLG